MTRCDKIWSNKIKIRDKHSCQICGITNGASIESAHIIPRTFMETRHDMKNGIALCYLHHKVGMFSLHNNPLWFYEWLKENKREQFDYLVAKMHSIAEKKHKIIK